MKPIFMFDIETTGTEIEKDEILQLAILELTKTESGFWAPGRFYERIIGTNRKPANKFAEEHMRHIYTASNAVYADEGNADPVEVRNKLTSFLEECGAPKNAMFAGKNVASFDLPFSYKAGFLQPGRYDQVTNEFVGDVHYRAYEMTGAISLIEDAFRLKRDEVQKRAHELYPLELPPECQGRTEHDALYDCFYQAQELNGLIALSRTLWRGSDG